MPYEINFINCHKPRFQVGTLMSKCAIQLYSFLKRSLQENRICAGDPTQLPPFIAGCRTTSAWFNDESLLQWWGLTSEMRICSSSDYLSGSEGTRSSTHEDRADYLHQWDHYCSCL